MNHLDKLKEIPWAAQESLFAELSKVSNVAALSPEELSVYEENLRMYRDNLACLEASYLDGFSDGIQQVALSLISRGMPDAEVAEITNLPPEKVRKLRES